MSSDILAGDVRVYYLDENRQKRMEWIGSATGTRTVNELYSALADLFDEPTTGDDATPMTAETPVEYTVGLIDANDADPYYLSFEMAQHLTGGAIKTAGWTHADGTDTGIIIVPVTTSSGIVVGDYGLDISGATTGNGTLLEILNIGETTQYLVIRPDSNAAGDNFTTNSQVITVNAHTGNQAQAGSNTGEMIWANLFNVTPINADTHVYMYQGLVSDATRTRVEHVNVVGEDWWPEGAFDRLIRTNDYTSTTLAVIDGGNITCFARKGNTLYDNFPIATSLTSGGRNPVPLSASADGNQTTGYKAFTGAGGTGTFAVGSEIQGDVSGARGIITQIDNPGATPTLHYYLIGDPQTDFNGSEAITDNDTTGDLTSSGAVSAQGPALATWFTSNAFPTAVHANTTSDIDDDGTAEGYGCLLDCNANPLTEVYEWTKYVTRNGAQTTAATDGIEGEQYVGMTVYLEYSGTVTLGTIVEGQEVIQTTTLASGIVVSHDTTLKQILLRDVRSTTPFNTSDTVVDQTSSGSMVPDVAAEAFDAVKSAPFGAFAGGRWFVARGVTLVDWLSADENNFQQIDSQGNARQRPIAIELSVSNLVGGAETLITSDQVWMHRLLGSGLAIDKAEYSAAGGEAVGTGTLVVDGSITADTPGKSAGGWLNIRDASDANQHYKIRFSSWATSTFTLAAIEGLTLTGATDTDTIVSSASDFATAKRGDFVWNATRSLGSYITTVDDANTIQISPAITGQISTDTIEINTVPVLIDTADDVYVSLIDGYAESATKSVSIVYVSPIFYRVKVANTRNATKIKRFVTDGTTAGTNQNTATIRTTDTIHT